MMRVFVYEHLSGAASADADSELRHAGMAMRDAVVRDLLHAGDCEVSVATGPGTPDLAVGARPVRPPPETSAVDFVAQQADLHDRVWVIAPETDGVLGRLQRVVGETRWLGCHAIAIALTSSKSATLAQATEHGLTTPLAFANSPATRRWVVKPDDGAGAVATRLHNTLAAARDDAAMRRHRGDSATLEAWVAGMPLSLSLVCGAAGFELLSVNRQQLLIDAAGTLSFTGVEIDVLRGDTARTLALRRFSQTLCDAVPGLRGYVGVDLVWHPQHGPVLIEINPRVTMAYVGLSIVLGRNLAVDVLNAHRSERADAAL